MRRTINFSEKWDKLSNDEYTTIRSTQYLMKHDLQIGDSVRITIKKKFDHEVILMDCINMRIQDMDLELLRKDVAPHKVEKYQDFVDGLNNILLKTRGFLGNHRLTTTKSILYLRKVKDNEV